MKRAFLVQMMEKYHEYFHLGFGLLSLLITCIIFPNSGFTLMFFLATMASFLPDADHLFFIFIYGRKTEYATQVRHYLFSTGLPSAIEYCRINHKKNNFILSHNLLTPLLSFGLFIYFVLNNSAYSSVFWLSFTAHFVFDIIEDHLALGRLNPNWFLRFSSKLRQS